MSQPRRVLSNAFILACARTWRLASGFVVAPYVLGHLGSEQYGLFAVLGTVTQYFGLLDFGLGTAFIKHLAEYVTRGERERARQVVTFGLLFYLALGFALTPIAYVLAPWIVGLLTLTPELKSTGAAILSWLFVYFFAGQAFSVFSQLQNGLQNMWIVAVVSSISQVVYIASVVVFLERGYGIYGAIAASFVQLAFNSVLSYIAAVRVFGPTLINPLRIELPVVKGLLKFGGWMQAMTMSLVVNEQTDRFLIGSFVNVASVTPYELANKLAFITKVFPGFGFEALLPAVASAATRGDRTALDRAVVQANRAVGFVTVAVSGFTVAAAAPLVQVWVGRGYPEVPAILVLLVIAYSVHNLTGVGSTVLRATGLPQYETLYSVLGAVLNVAATLALAPMFHLFGIIVGTVIGTVVGSAYFLWLFHRIRGISLWVGLGQWLWRLTAAAGLATAITAWLVSLIPTEFFVYRVQGLAVIGLLSLAYGVCLLVLVRLTGFIQPGDASFVARMLPPQFVHVLYWRPLQRALGWIAP